MNFKKNENKGFSLVELIVVIAIMAVLTSVLAPALLQYVERSRAQKDSSAMGEVTNAVRIALADQNVYDEFLTFMALDVPKGIDEAGEPDASGFYPALTDDDNNELTMHGAYIAFANDANAFTLGEALVNGGLDTYNYFYGTPTVSDWSIAAAMPKLTEQLTATIGPDVKLTSQSYRNSDYVVFIESDENSHIDVRGYWNGIDIE